MNYPPNPTFVIETLGCKVNQYETQAIREHLVQNGFIEKKIDQTADFYIINSCTVTHKADADTRNFIHRFHKLNPTGKIVIAGCYAELDGDREALMKISGVTHLVRNSEKEKMTEILSTVHGPRSTVHSFKITDFKARNRAFIKIQDGCNHKCSYCKVNLVRGPSRSRCTDEILKEAKALIDKGFKEIILTGICLGAWGMDFKRKENLAGIINKISQLQGNFRIRLSSIEPIYVDDEVVKIVRNNDKVCKHLHIPLQSGDGRILKLMQRPYTAGKFTQLITLIRKYMPDAAITTDVLVGFPGENERGFRNTLKLIKHIKPSRMHVFSYSRREGTAAAKFKADLDEKAVKERVEFLTNLSNEFSLDFAGQFIGKKQDAVIESQRDKRTGLLCGYTDRYIRILADGPDSLKNMLLPVTIDHLDRNKRIVFAAL